MPTPRTRRNSAMSSTLAVMLLLNTVMHLVTGDGASGMVSDTTPRIEVREGDDELLHLDLLSPNNGHLKADQAELLPDAKEAKESAFKEFDMKSAETERSKDSSGGGGSGNPSVDEIISGIIQLIGGNVKLGRPPAPPPQMQMQPHEQDFGHNSRINNRAPARVTFIGAPGQHMPHMVPPNVLIGPGPPAGLPLPLSPYHKLHKQPPHGMPPAKGIHESDITSLLLGQAVRPFPKDREVQQQQTRKVFLKQKPNLPDSATLLTSSQAANHIPAENFSPPGDQDHSPLPAEAPPSRNPSPGPGPTRDAITPSEEAEPEVVAPTRTQLRPDRISFTQVSKIAEPGHPSVVIVNVAADESEESRPETPDISAPKIDTLPKQPVAISESEQDPDQAGGPIPDWLPVGLASHRPSKTWTDEPPLIITADEGPSVFDITIKHKIGAGASVKTVSPPSSSFTRATVSSTEAASSVESIAPTSVTDEELSVASTATAVLASTPPHIRETTLSEKEMTKAPITPSSTERTSSRIVPSARPPTHSVKREPTGLSREAEDVVYGKPALEANRPIAPSVPEVTLVGSGVLSTQKTEPTSTVEPSVTSYHRPPQHAQPGMGRPIVVPVDVDDVKPHMGRQTPTQAVVTERGQGSVYIDGRPTHFKIRPNAAGPTLQVGSGVTVNAGNELPGGKPPKTLLPNNPGPPPKIGAANPAQRPTPPPKQPAIRRPPFRPRPQVPLVRIDTCIVGDDTTCDMKLNERCKTELGISSCQCKPGFGRTTARGMCSPVAALGISLRVDRMGENKLSFSRNYMNANSEEYQYLEYESLQALNSMFAVSRLSKVFMGVKVNKFYAVSGKLVVNATIELEMNNATKAATIKRVVQQELSRVIALRNNNIGDSQLWVDASVNAIPRVDDINECSNPDLNDCSPLAKCLNDFGSFRCACKNGYEDKYGGDSRRAGRHCTACSPQYCSNRGECVIIRGERECRCKGNFIGSKCDIDGEVLGVAVGGSVAALVIIIITFLCLYMWNQRWKSEQQKMEAMSAASAQTFSYVNKQQVAGYRYAMDERYRWAQQMQQDAASYYANPEHLIATSQQHLYATPSRVQTPDDLLSEDMMESRHYSRPMRSKSRNSTIQTIHGHYQAPTLPMGPGSIYNETEFSTRETLYTPSHLIVSPRSNKYAVYS